MERAVAQVRALFPLAHQDTQEMQNRPGLLLLLRSRQRRMRWAGREPGRAVRETKAGFCGVPGHWRAAAVAALEQGIIQIADRIAKLVPSEFHFRQAQLLALIKQNGAPQ